MSSTETAKEFLAGYAKRSGESAEELLSRRVVATCGCDYAGCTGWQLIPEDCVMPWRDVVAIRA